MARIEALPPNTSKGWTALALGYSDSVIQKR
jgi:hypothetical protein